MSDDADFAAELAAAEITAGLARVDRAIPVGAPGECDECGEEMPRLVGGRCGYCRDGRKPPLSRFDGPAPAPTPTSTLEEMRPMPALTRRTISCPAEPEEYARIEAYAATADQALGRATLHLAQVALDMLDKPAPAPIAPLAQALLAATDLPMEALLNEVRRRMESAADRGDLEAAEKLNAAATARADAAEARAAEAEARFAKLRAALAELA